MVDIHNHILFGIDDGCVNIEESIILLIKMKKIGFNKVILTPHYIKGSKYNCNNLEKIHRLNQLKEAIRQYKINIDIYLGNEVFVTNDIVELLEKNVISSINGTRYILIELPFENEIISLSDLLYELRYNNLIPIIAHPERYSYFKDKARIKELKDEGVLFQVNYSSILGYYGKDAKKIVKYLLKNNYVDFFGTDIHRVNNTYVLDNFSLIKKKIIRIIGEDRYKEIISNGEKIINNYYLK